MLSFSGRQRLLVSAADLNLGTSLGTHPASMPDISFLNDMIL